MRLFGLAALGEAFNALDTAGEFIVAGIIVMIVSAAWMEIAPWFEKHQAQDQKQDKSEQTHENRPRQELHEESSSDLR